MLATGNTLGVGVYVPEKGTVQNNKYKEIGFGKIKLINGVFDIASAINNLPDKSTDYKTVLEDEIPLFTGLLVNIPEVRYVAYVVKGKGKGIYGINGDITLVDSELYLLKDNQQTSTFNPSNDPNANLEDLGEIANGDYLAVINAANPAYVIVAGTNWYFQFTVGGKKKLYGFIGANGTYGAGQTQMVSGDLFLIYDETLPNNITDVSVKDNNGIEQFRITNDIQFEGVVFDAPNKRVKHIALQRNTLFLSTTGDDALAQENNDNLPFKTLDAATSHLLAQGHLGENWFIETLDNGTYNYTLANKTFNGFNIRNESDAKIYIDNAMTIVNQWIWICPTGTMYFRYLDTTTLVNQTFIYHASGTAEGRYVKHLVRNVEFVNNATGTPATGRGIIRTIGNIDTFLWQTLTIQQGADRILDATPVTGVMNFGKIINYTDTNGTDPFTTLGTTTFTEIFIGEYQNQSTTTHILGNIILKVNVNKIVSPNALVKLITVNHELREDTSFENTQMRVYDTPLNVINGNGFLLTINNNISADVFDVKPGTVKTPATGYSTTTAHYLKDIRIKIQGTSLTPNIAKVDLRAGRNGNQFVFDNVEIEALNNAFLLRIDNHVNLVPDYQIVFRNTVRIKNNNYLVSTGVGLTPAQTILIKENASVIHDFSQISANPLFQKSILDASTYINTQKDITASYTVIDEDYGQTIWLNSATAINVTIDDTLRDNFECYFYNIGAGTVTFVAGTATVSLPDGTEISTNKNAKLIKRLANNDYKVKIYGSGKLIATDHGAATNPEVVNTVYGTNATPPAANTVTEGALYIQYTP